jgi:hypothetical protein
VSFLTGNAAVSEIQLLGRLVSARDFGKLSLVPYSVCPKLLPRDMGHRRGSAFSYPLYILCSMLLAEGAVSFNLLWHFHFISSLKFNLISQILVTKVFRMNGWECDHVILGQDIILSIYSYKHRNTIQQPHDLVFLIDIFLAC